jgi:transketolase
MTEAWESLRHRATRRLLKMHYEAGVGHLGGNLSCLDILLYLHHHVMKPPDVFILSKGHAAGALYITLWTLGKLSDDDLKTFHKDNTLLPGHITAALGTFTTGSLGHGLPLAVGMAMADRLARRKRRTFCLLSDGELQEGSNWEAYNFARAQMLGNLKTIVDANGLQGFDSCAAISPHRFAAPDFTGDGHDPASIQTALESPALLVCLRTVKGLGVPCFEGKLESHYLPLSKEQLEEALQVAYA